MSGVENLSLPGRVADGDFGGWVKEAMATRGISQRMLGMRTGISHSTISRIIAGNRTPSLPTAVAILRVLVPASSVPAVVGGPHSGSISGPKGVVGGAEAPTLTIVPHARSSEGEPEDLASR